jgi:hypothetical protein
MILWGASPLHGPLAPPGKYQVVITADGHTASRWFELRLDPRLQSVTVADVTEQFTLAMAIRNKTDTANQAVILIRELKKKLTDAGKLTAANKELLARLSVIEENLYQVRNQSGQDPLNFPIKLNNRLAALERSVETGDAKPTAGAYQVYEELSKELELQLSELSKIVRPMYRNRAPVPSVLQLPR